MVFGCFRKDNTKIKCTFNSFSDIALKTFIINFLEQENLVFFNGYFFLRG